MTKRVELIKRRMRLGLTRQDIASRAGLSAAGVTRIENGRYPKPSNVPKLARAYELTPQEFVDILYIGR